MKNLKIFKKISSKNKFKLAPMVCALALTSALIPSMAVAAEDNVEVNYIYTNDILNPFNWNVECKGVNIDPTNNNISMSTTEFEKLLNSKDDTVALKGSDGIVLYNKESLKNASLNPNTNIMGILAGKGALMAIAGTGAIIAIEAIARLSQAKAGNDLEKNIKKYCK